MNDLLEHMYEQAMEPNGIEGIGGSYTDLNPEAFAKQIIEECIRMCRCASDGLRSQGRDKAADGADEAALYITEHFKLKD